MRPLKAIIAGAALAVLGTTAFAAASPRLDSEARLAKALEGRVAGKPVNCINLRDIRSTEIIDRTAILYRVSGTKLYVNRPTIGASSLDRNNVPVLKTSMNQVCSVDTLQMYDTGSRMQAGFVGLGEFVPYTKVAAK